MWRNWNPHTLLVGMCNSAIAVENSLTDPQKLNIKLPYDPPIPFLVTYPEELKKETQILTPMFTVALFTIVKK